VTKNRGVTRTRVTPYSFTMSAAFILVDHDFKLSFGDQFLPVEVPLGANVSVLKNLRCDENSIFPEHFLFFSLISRHRNKWAPI
jgi:hypothetical protein